LKKEIFKITTIEKEKYNPKYIFKLKEPHIFLHHKLIYDLLVPYNDMRLKRLIEVLKEQNILYKIQENTQAKNVVVSLGKSDEPKIVIGAHYDIVDNSFGINDNTCSIAMLISLIKELQNKAIDKAVEIVFFDREETGMHGSRLYIEENFNKIDYAIILDIIGVGDTLVFGTKNESIARKLNSLKLKRSFYELTSDNLSFKNNNIPVAIITAAHMSDMTYLYDNVYQIDNNAKYIQTMHGGLDDNRIEIINNLIINDLLTQLLKLILKNKCSNLFANS